MSKQKPYPNTFDGLNAFIEKKRNNYNKYFVSILILIFLSIVSRIIYLSQILH